METSGGNKAVDTLIDALKFLGQRPPAVSRFNACSACLMETKLVFDTIQNVDQCQDNVEMELTIARDAQILIDPALCLCLIALHNLQPLLC